MYNDSRRVGVRGLVRGKSREQQLVGVKLLLQAVEWNEGHLIHYI